MAHSVRMCWIYAVCFTFVVYHIWSVISSHSNVSSEDREITYIGWKLIGIQLHCFENPKDVYLNISDTSAVDQYTPQCDNGSKIQLMAYTYQQRDCGANQTCVVKTEEPFLPKQEYLIQELCSFKERCANMTRLLVSDYHNPTANAIHIQYQCQDNKEFINVCNNQTKVLNNAAHLVYTSFVHSVKDCQCFVKDNMVTIFLNDIRLQQRTVKRCSAAKLQINNVQFLCDNRMDTFGSRFREDFGETSSRAFISLTNVPVGGKPRMLWITIKPQGSVSITCTSTHWNPVMTQLTRGSTPVAVTTKTNSWTTIRIQTNYTSSHGWMSNQTDDQGRIVYKHPRTTNQTHDQSRIIYPHTMTTNQTDDKGNQEVTKLLTIAVVSSCTGGGLITALVIFVFKRNILSKCRRQSECDEKNMKTTEQGETILDSMQYTGCLRHKNAACECLSHGENTLNDYEHRPEDNSETHTGDYHTIKDFESPRETVYELIKPENTDSANEYFHGGNKEINIDMKGRKLPTPPSSCHKHLVLESDDLSVPNRPIYLRLSQNDDFVQSASIDIGDYLNPTAKDTGDHLHHRFVDTDDYLHPVATDIDDNTHPLATESCIMHEK